MMSVLKKQVVGNTVITLETFSFKGKVAFSVCVNDVPQSTCSSAATAGKLFDAAVVEAK